MTSPYGPGGPLGSMPSQEEGGGNSNGAGQNYQGRPNKSQPCSIVVIQILLSVLVWIIIAIGYHFIRTGNLGLF